MTNANAFAFSGDQQLDILLFGRPGGLSLLACLHSTHFARLPARQGLKQTAPSLAQTLPTCNHHSGGSLPGYVARKASQSFRPGGLINICFEGCREIIKPDDFYLLPIFVTHATRGTVRGCQFGA